MHYKEAKFVISTETKCSGTSRVECISLQFGSCIGENNKSWWVEGDAYMWIQMNSELIATGKIPLNNILLSCYLRAESQRWTADSLEHSDVHIIEGLHFSLFYLSFASFCTCIPILIWNQWNLHISEIQRFSIRSYLRYLRLISH